MKADMVFIIASNREVETNILVKAARKPKGSQEEKADDACGRSHFCFILVFHLHHWIGDSTVQGTGTLWKGVRSRILWESLGTGVLWDDVAT
ncbi:hypothetical protein E2C01_023298 [Portunus trituberculatus]|uniref:Uncharacterized protein n=1 Tax=Portunus trituberculatus TaxID=210409 RepID=A0A5B7EB84_PORTR|nr:hypothetical protein [Portunus trituberculatus]